MDNPRVTVIPATFGAINKMAFSMKQVFDAADREGEDNPRLADLVEQDRLTKHAADHCLERMQAHGAFYPMMALISRRCLQVVMLAGGVPQDPVEQITIATALRVLIAVSSIEAYWLASEVWLAEPSNDPAVRRLQPRQREDKREGLALVTATPASYRIRMFATERAPDGKASDLREMRGAPQMSNPLMQNLFAGRDKLRGEALRKMAR
jgi:hypothetical protein